MNLYYVRSSNPGATNLFYLKRQFHSSSAQYAAQTKDFKFQNISSKSISDFSVFRPKVIMFSKKKKGLHLQSISNFPILRQKIIVSSKKKRSSDIARYNLWNVFHL